MKIKRYPSWKRLIGAQGIGSDARLTAGNHVVELGPSAICIIVDDGCFESLIPVEGLIFSIVEGKLVKLGYLHPAPFLGPSSLSSLFCASDSSSNISKI